MKLLEWLKRLRVKCRKWLFDLKWKGTLPEEFDVFCIGDMVRDESEGDLNIPGNLYVSGSLDVFNLFVGSSVIVDNRIDAADITVQDGSCICSRDVTALNVSVSNGDFISDGSIDTYEITVHNGDCIVHHAINSCAINVDGFLDCYDVDSNECEIRATDFVCRYFEEEN